MAIRQVSELTYRLQNRSGFHRLTSHVPELTAGLFEVLRLSSTEAKRRNAIVSTHEAAAHIKKVEGICR